MGDDEQGHLDTILLSDNRVLIATVATLLLATGSCLIWGTKRMIDSNTSSTAPSIIPDTAEPVREPEPNPVAGKSEPQPKLSVDAESVASGTDAKNISRSKERRKRRKDPLRDLMKKAGKDGRGILPTMGSSKGHSEASSSNASPSKVPIILEPDDRDSSVGPSSRSVSPNPAAGSENGGGSSNGDFVHPNEPLTAKALPSTEEIGSELRVEIPQTKSEPTECTPSTAVDTPLPNGVSSPSVKPVAPSFCSPPCSPPSSTFLPSSYSLPVYSTAVPWEFTKPTYETSSNNNAYRKPPRFRSNSPLPSSLSFTSFSPSHASTSSTSTSASAASTSSTSASTSLSPPAPETDTAPTSFTYPTLNDVSPSPLHISTSSSPSSRYLTPRTPTPGSSITGISVSTQTQMASLRGALEAARLREEKARVDMEKYAKECELLRWRWSEDAAARRRREVELQTHIHHLMLQLQAYASVYAVSPTLQHQPFSPLAHPHNQPFSNSKPSTPFPPRHSAHSPPSQHQSPFGTPPLHHINSINPNANANANLISLLFPNQSSGSGTDLSSSVGSVSGTSSAASLSPVLDSAPLRGRTPNRPNGHHMVNSSHVNGDLGEGTSNGDAGWVGVNEVEDEGFSGILANAILKRPESMRAAQSENVEGKRKEDDVEEEKEIEFVFPSIANGSGGSASWMTPAGNGSQKYAGGKSDQMEYTGDNGGSGEVNENGETLAAG